MLFHLKFFMFRLLNMLPVYPDPISIANSSFTNVLFFACWTNDYVDKVSTVACHLLSNLWFTGSNNVELYNKCQSAPVATKFLQW